MYATVRIETVNSSGGIGSGTGFFFQIDTSDGKVSQLIITNRHVVRDGITGSLYLHRAADTEVFSPNGQTCRITIPNESSLSSNVKFEMLWTPHPDESIDICALNFTPFIQKLRHDGTPIYWQAIDKSFVYSQEQLESLMAVEDVLMVGYPIGLADPINNFPLMRMGITASHPAIDYRGRPEGLVDMACFPGSSGSPIFLYNQTMYYDKMNGTSRAGPRDAFLGILYAGPTMDATGQITVQDIPTSAKQSIVSITPMMIHLGYYLKAREIVTIAEHMRMRILSVED